MSPLRRMAWLSIVTSLVTLGLKLTAAYITVSVSLLSDALEGFVNLAAGAMALAAVTIAERPADDNHAYGHDKVEYFSSGVEGALILVAALLIVAAAAKRFIDPVPLTALGPGLLVAVLAACANLATASVMLRTAKQHDSLAIEADARHLLTDVWTTVGVVVGLLVVLIAPQWALLDPIIAVLVAIHILWTGLALLRRAVDGLMDASLPAEETAQAEQLIRAHLPPGAHFHALRTRKSGARRFLDFHLLVPGQVPVAEAHAACDRIETALRSGLGNASITIHVEPSENHRPHPGD